MIYLKNSIIIFENVPVWLGNFLDGRLPFFKKYHQGTDYYPNSKKFYIYLK